MIIRLGFRDRESEDGGQKTGDRDQGEGVRGQKTEDRSQKTGDKGQGAGVRSGFSSETGIALQAPQV